MRIVAVDWSGSSNPAYQRRHIWRADAIDGKVVSLRAGRTRDELVDDLIDATAQDGEPLVVGLDFAFSLPGWYLDQIGLDPPALWARIAEEALTPGMRTIGLAAWIAAPETPFWRTARPEHVACREFRRTELETVGPGIRPKSTFQLVGPGQVGPGSLHGMQALHRLSEAGFAIWPFDPPSFPLAIEIYPRAYVGKAPTNTEAARAAHLAELPLDPDLRAAAIGSVDAFDALVSALRMAEHQAHLTERESDPADALEGRIWTPGSGAPARRGDGVVAAYVDAWNEPDPEERTASTFAGSQPMAAVR